MTIAEKSRHKAKITVITAIINSWFTYIPTYIMYKITTIGAFLASFSDCWLVCIFFNCSITLILLYPCLLPFDTFFLQPLSISFHCLCLVVLFIIWLYLPTKMTTNTNTNLLQIYNYPVSCTKKQTRWCRWRNVVKSTCSQFITVAGKWQQ